MKKILVSAAILAVLLSAVACIANPLIGKRIKGSGNIVTRTIDAPAFTSIDASRAVKVIISNKVTDKITIQADDNLIEYVVVKADGQELDVTIDKSVQNVSNFDITVTVPANGQIRSLEASSAAKITAITGLAAPEFEISASSAAQIKAAVKTTQCEIEASSAAEIDAAISTSECEITASSASKINLSGNADNCTATTSSAAKLNAGTFTVKNLTVSSSSGSGADVSCILKLNASASSGAGITYSGDCHTDINRSSGGSVHKN